MNEDRLGSAVKHFPYGEEPATSGQDRVKFATYYRDETTTLDYADQRYYLRTIGRFLTADPYRASAGPTGPQSWNRYAYVQGDPVNFLDPGGLDYFSVHWFAVCAYATWDGSWEWLCGDSDPTRAYVGVEVPRKGGWRAGGGSESKRSECDRSNPANARVLDFIARNTAAAKSVAASVGVGAEFILAWAGFESLYGTGSAARLDNNNFYGLTALGKEVTGGWIGAVPCSQKSGITFGGFACFPTDEVNDMYGGNNLYYSALAAFTSQNGRYLNAALAAQQAGGDISAIANAIAKAGFNSEPTNYGAGVAEAASAIKRREDCP